MSVRANTLVGIAAIAASFGLALGAAGATLLIISHRYIDLGMYRLAIMTLQGCVNSTLPTFVVLTLTLYGLLLLLDGKPVRHQQWFLASAVMVVLIAAALFVIKWFAVPISSLHWWIRKISAEFLRCVRGEATVSYFLTLLRTRLTAGLVLVATVAALVVTSGILARIDWRTRLKSLKQPKYRYLLLSVILGAVGLNLGLVIDSRVNEPEGFNVILIGIDTWRADHVSSFGYSRMTTPNIDRIAQRSASFTKAYATTSWTLPSFHSILTSLYQSSHGVIDGRYRLGNWHVTLAEIMKNEGYRTGGFISGTYLKSSFGFNQGFDIYHEAVTSAALIETYDDVTSPRLTELVMPWVRDSQDRSFFLFIHYWDPHYDYIPPPPYDKMFDPHYDGDIKCHRFRFNDRINPDMDPRDLEHIIALYDAEIAWTDWHIGKIIDTLEDLDMMRRTIIVLVGDHGDEFFEHGCKGHHQNLYNTSIHVPMIFAIPGIEQPKCFDMSVSTVDLLPTIVDVIGLGLPNRVEGRSLGPIIYGEDLPRQGPSVYSELGTNKTALINGSWKLLHNSDTGVYELYDLATDFGETRNLIDDETQVASRFKSQITQWIERHGPRRVDAPWAVRDSETKKQLKALGYTQ